MCLYCAQGFSKSWGVSAWTDCNACAGVASWGVDSIFTLLGMEGESESAVVATDV